LLATRENFGEDDNHAAEFLMPLRVESIPFPDSRPMQGRTTMLAYLRSPNVDLGTLILRLGLAAIFIMHGFALIYQAEAVTYKLSLSMQRVVGWAELACGLALLVGFLSRLAAVGVIVIMIGAIEMVTGTKGFLPISFSPAGFNFEPGAAYNFIIIVACLALLVLGSGRLSVDYLLFGRQKRVATTAVPQPASLAPSPEVPTERTV
jgi:putative oxidoreductase